MNLTIELIPLSTACRLMGISRRTLNEHSVRGLVPQFVTVTGAKKGLPKHEVTALIGARIANKSDDEVRQLVGRLMRSREQLGAELLGEAA